MPLSRRDFMLAAAGAGVATVFASAGFPEGYSQAAVRAAGGLGAGTTPEQIHLTWGADASKDMTVSWASAAPEVTPQLLVYPAPHSKKAFKTYNAIRASYTDGISGETAHAYHVPLKDLSPDTEYAYVVRDAATPEVTFTSSFRTAGEGRFPFAFTSFGDLGTPGAGATYTLADGSTVTSTTYSESQWNAYNAVGEVENLAPLFHLLNGDLCYADKETITATGATSRASAGAQPAPEVWRDFGLNVQRSAANRPWMPCIGNHEAELDNGPQRLRVLQHPLLGARATTPAFPGNFYSFQVGSVLFISLDANDVCYQGARRLQPRSRRDHRRGAQPGLGHRPPVQPVLHGRLHARKRRHAVPGGTRPTPRRSGLSTSLTTARPAPRVDWIVVQMHQCALSSSTDNGCDVAIRQAWVPLFDKFQVDLVVNGHDHDYERSFPVRGFTPNLGTSTFAGGAVTNAAGTVTLPSTKGQTVNTLTPKVVTTDETSPFDTSKGTVYMVLGGGGTNKRDNVYGAKVANATTFTQIRTGSTKPAADATEPAELVGDDRPEPTPTGSRTSQVDPGEPGGNTTITVTYYHAPTQTTGTPSYSVLETFQLTRRARTP